MPPDLRVYDACVNACANHPPRKSACVHERTTHTHLREVCVVRSCGAAAAPIERTR